MSPATLHSLATARQLANTAGKLAHRAMQSGEPESANALRELFAGLEPYPAGLKCTKRDCNRSASKLSVWHGQPRVLPWCASHGRRKRSVDLKSLFRDPSTLVHDLHYYGLLSADVYAIYVFLRRNWCFGDHDEPAI